MENVEARSWTGRQANFRLARVGGGGGGGGGGGALGATWLLTLIFLLSVFTYEQQGTSLRHAYHCTDFNRAGCSHKTLTQNGPSCSRPWKPSPGLERQPPKEQIRSDGSPHRGTRTKSDFCLNKNGRLVSKKQSANGKKAFKNIRGWTQAVSKARKALGITGFCAVKKGTPLYKKAREFYCALPS